jgi:hypothetical protein
LLSLFFSQIKPRGSVSFYRRGHRGTRKLQHHSNNQEATKGLQSRMHTSALSTNSVGGEEVLLHPDCVRDFREYSKRIRNGPNPEDISYLIGNSLTR